MAFFNTEQETSTSGTRNSGGIVNIPGPVFLRVINIQPASGQATAVSTSGVVLAVQHATSGMFAQLSGTEIFRFDGAAHSGLGTANYAPRFDLMRLNVWCPSGIVTLNSGTHLYDLIVYTAT